MKVKICGITEAKTLVLARQLGFDAAGFIFYQDSPRGLSLEQAERILREAEEISPLAAQNNNTATPPSSPDVRANLPRTAIAAVFVNASYTFIEEAVGTLNVDLLQLHGEESLKLIENIRSNFPNLSIWKAFSLQSPNTLLQAKEQYAPLFPNFSTFSPNTVHTMQLPARQKPKQPLVEDALLLDAYHKTRKGGTGKSIPAELITPWLQTEANIVLAGGIGLENIEEVLRLKPYAIDLNSKLEKSPGVKDGFAMKNFMAAYRKAILYL